MANKDRDKVTTVREHPLRVPVSKKNPKGITIRDQHPRRINGTYLDAAEIEAVFKNYDRKGVSYPTKAKLKDYNDADKNDDVIAVWTDYLIKSLMQIHPLIRML